MTWFRQEGKNVWRRATPTFYSTSDSLRHTKCDIHLKIGSISMWVFHWKRKILAQMCKHPSGVVFQLPCVFYPYKFL